jgi:hypothetical protein
MKSSRTPSIALMLSSREEESLWLAALASQRIGGFAVAPMGGAPETLAGDPRIANCDAFMADAPDLQALGLDPRRFAAALRARNPGLAFFLRLPARSGIGQSERAWARSQGIASLLPGSTVAAWKESFLPVFERVLAAAGRAKVDVAALELAISLRVRRGEEPRPGPVKDIYGEARMLDRAGIKPGGVIAMLQGRDGVAVADRAYRGKTYRECFVAAEAVDRVQRELAIDRSLATAACSFLWRTGRIHHVLRDAPFADDLLFFRFAGTRDELDAVDLAEVQAAMQGPAGVAVADRTYLAKAYPRTFVGSEAVEWLVSRYRVSLGAAEAIGQRLLELGEFRHVLGEHGFVHARYFYRFTADETLEVA